MNAKWFTPAVTPFLPDGSIDFDSIGTHIEHLIDAGIDGVLYGGSIGEFFAQTMEQRKSVIDYIVRKVAGRIKVVIGTTSMVAEEVAPLSNYALSAGADAIMIVPPFYFSFGDEEVFTYYDQLTARIQGPVYIYNFPDRTGYSISPAVIRRLVEAHENIVGVKDTITGVDHTREIIKAVKPIRPDFEVYSGFDDNFAHNVLSGGSGCIGGMSNFAPQLCAGWVKAMRENDMEKVAAYQQKVNRCMDVYFIGSPFVPYVKEACRQAGYIAHAKATFPMPDLDETEQAKVKAFLVREELLP